MTEKFDEIFDVNRRFWDASTPAKMNVGSYPLDTFGDGSSTLFPHEHDELGDVTEKTILHLQCNNGLETLSLARMGATVIGIDISGESLRCGQRLATEAGIDADFVQCNIYDVSNIFAQQFDIVYTSRGVLVWLPALSSWANNIVDLVRPGGTFYIYEGHPIADSYDDDLAFDGSYFDTHPRLYEQAGFGVDKEHYRTQHTLGAVTTALASAGLSIEFVHEFPFAFWRRWEGMVTDEQGRWCLPDDPIPLSFSIRATRPAKEGV